MESIIYELRPEPATLGGAIGIISNGLRLLHRLGVYEALLARGSSHSGLVVHSMQGGVLSAQEDAVSYARGQTGFGYMRIKRTDLMDVMLGSVKGANIPIHFGKRLTSIEDDENRGVIVTFSDGTTDTADLLLGCDGIHSQVRRLYVDPDLVPQYTGISGFGSIIPTSRLSPAAVEQLSGLDVTLTREGIFAAMSCTAAGNEIYWGFSREVAPPKSGDGRDGWEVHREEEVEGFKSNLHKVLADSRGDWGAAMREVIDNTEVVKFYPVFKLPFGGAWSKSRCLLIGDAAHAMPPHAGQGVSMALEDAFLLSRLLENPRRSLDEVFGVFDRIRRPHVNEINGIATRNAGMRKNSGPWGLWMKEIGIRVIVWVYWVFGLQKWGLGQKHSVYDIDKEHV